MTTASGCGAASSRPAPQSPTASTTASWRGGSGLSGGNIKNIVVSAAYLASANGGRIGMPHLIRATWGEHRKIGRVLSATDAGEYVSLVPAPDPDLAG